MIKHILIAGGTSGIGLELVKHLASSGDQITVACRNPEKLSEFPGVETVHFEATDPAPGFSEPDSLDGFVYCPGTINLKPFPRLTEEDFLKDFEINVLGMTRILRHILPALKKGSDPAIVLFSTVAVQTGLPFHSSISASKGAVEGLIRALAAEFAPKIRVNGIAPSLTDSPLAAQLLNGEEKREASANRHPLKRIGDPVHFAKLAAFLLGEESSFTTGQIYKMDGGLSAIKSL
ncbi:MAG: SDR family NAD(P)-dependent oxidoreductase [Verrucomicrobiales bacterium]|nr:SDR family NAD(P)-dependent oxidoreductase [Verrucomicrobiales bacterium]